MRKVTRFLLLAWLISAFLSLGNASPAYAGDELWTSLGPYGGAFSLLVIDPQHPSILYIGTDSGVYKSENAGLSWRPASTGLPDGGQISISSLVIDRNVPTVLYAGFGNSSIFKTSDGGAHWSQVYAGDSHLWSYLTIAPTTPPTLYRLTDTGILRSTDGGATWKNPSYIPGQVGPLTGILADPSTPTTVYFSARSDGDPSVGGGIYKSTNGGDTWSKISERGGALLAIDPEHPNILYMSNNVYVGGPGLLKSIDGGVSWTEVSAFTTLEVSTLTIDPTSDTLYVGTETGGFKSIDDGAHWTQLDPSSFGSLVNCFIIDPLTPSTIYACAAPAGVIRSSDGGQTWLARNQGLAFLSISGLVINPMNPSMIYTGTAGGGVFKSSDGGQTWMPSNSGLTSLQIAAIVIDPRTPNTLYASALNAGVFKTVDGAGHWTPINSGLGSVLDVSALAIDWRTPSTIYAGFGASDKGVYKSSNAGATWNPSSTGQPGVSQAISQLVVDPLISSTLYAITGDGLFKSVNSGSQWRQLPVPATTLAIHPQRSGTVYAGTYDGGVFKSVDGGETWQALSVGLSNLFVGALAVDPARPRTVYAGSFGGGVSRSISGAEGGWLPIDRGLANRHINRLVLAPSTNPTAPTRLYAGTRQGVFEITLPPLHSVYVPIVVRD